MAPSRGYVSCATAKAKCAWLGVVIGFVGCAAIFSVVSVGAISIAAQVDACEGGCDAELLACADSLPCECHCGALAEEGSASQTLGADQCADLKAVMFDRAIAPDRAASARRLGEDGGDDGDEDDEDEDNDGGGDDDDDDDDDDDEDEDDEDEEDDGDNHDNDHGVNGDDNEEAVADNDSNNVVSGDDDDDDDDDDVSHRF